jgi:hypothetical protein
MCVVIYGFVLAAALRAVDALLGESIANALQSTAFAELAADEVVHVALGLVDGLDAGDFGLVEGVCCGSMSVSIHHHMQRTTVHHKSFVAIVIRLTLGSVAGLVVVGEPLEVLVLDPRHPVLVLVVVALLHPLEVALALLLLLGEGVEGLLLLVFAHLVPAVAC